MTAQARFEMRTTELLEKAGIRGASASAIGQRLGVGPSAACAILDRLVYLGVAEYVDGRYILTSSSWAMRLSSRVLSATVPNLPPGAAEEFRRRAQALLEGEG